MTLLHPIRRVRRRLRMQAALHAASRAAVVAVAAMILAVYLWRLGVIAPRTLFLVGGGDLLLIAGLALAFALRRIPLARAAQRIDASHALHDRLGSALAFSDEKEPTPFMKAAIEDAERAAATVEIRRAAPIRRPDELGAAAALAAVAVGVAILQFPGRAPPRMVVAPGVSKMAVDHDALGPEIEAAEELFRNAEDPEQKAMAEELQKLLQQLDDEQLTRKEVFDKLSELEKRALPHADGDFDALKRALAKAGVELGKSKLTREAGKALEKEDLEKAKKELEKLADQAEKLAEQKKQLDRQEEAARALQKAAEAKQEKSEEEKKREQEEKRLKEEERRLKRELAQKPNDQELQRRLKKNQRELERLEKEKQQRAEQKRKLERLQRELQKAAEEMRKKLSPEVAEALRKAAQQLGQMEDEIKKLGNAQRMQVQIAELKEVLRRAGQRQQGQGQGQNGQGQQQGQQGQGQQRQGQGQQGQNGQAQNGQGKGKPGEKMLREFNERAGGNKPSVLLLGAGGDTRVLLPLGGGGGEKPGPQGEGKGDDRPGDGIGDQHDPNLRGDPTRLDARRKETRVVGKEGEGPSRSETILGSSEKGFATRAYKRVYGDYTSVMEEVMSKERVPPGYRYYIKRYFQLIKPRE